jgi:hypothetical protein
METTGPIDEVTIIEEEDETPVVDEIAVRNAEIKEFRTAGLTYASIAKHVGLSATMVSKICKGE